MPQSDGKNKLKRVEFVFDGKSYQFNLNPQEYEQTEPMRGAVTQTKGGAWVDHFGGGLVQIYMKGTTGFQNGFTKWKELRDLLRSYYNSIKPGQTPTKFITFHNFTDEESWIVTIDPQSGFRLSRSKSNPLLYMYEIYMICLRPAQYPGPKTSGVGTIPYIKTNPSGIGNVFGPAVPLANKVQTGQQPYVYALPYIQNALGINDQGQIPQTVASYIANIPTTNNGMILNPYEVGMNTGDSNNSGSNGMDMGGSGSGSNGTNMGGSGSSGSSTGGGSTSGGGGVVVGGSSGDLLNTTFSPQDVYRAIQGAVQSLIGMFPQMATLLPLYEGYLTSIFNLVQNYITDADKMTQILQAYAPSLQDLASNLPGFTGNVDALIGLLVNLLQTSFANIAMSNMGSTGGSTGSSNVVNTSPNMVMQLSTLAMNAKTAITTGQDSNVTVGLVAPDSLASLVINLDTGTLANATHVEIMIRATLLESYAIYQALQKDPSTFSQGISQSDVSNIIQNIRWITYQLADIPGYDMTIIEGFRWLERCLSYVYNSPSLFGKDISSQLAGYVAAQQAGETITWLGS